MTPNFKTPETIKVTKEADEVMCDGGMGPLGHPIVYYTFDKSDTVECGYCDRVFTKSV
ncbi:MAG: zinc-finger domain-containing protein [Micavibrio sp.]|nr:zinc-finger domain-containing protein [Micavibrio sp.]